MSDNENGTTKVPTMASYEVKVKGGLKTEPSRMDGWVYRFPTLPLDATEDDAIAFLRSRVPEGADPDSVIPGFIKDAWESFCDRERKSWQNRKAEVEGKERKEWPQRSEIATQEQVAEFSAGLTLEPPRVSEKDEIAAERDRAVAKLSTMQETILGLLRDKPKKEGQEQLSQLIADGTLPEGTTL